MQLGNTVSVQNVKYFVLRILYSLVVCRGDMSRRVGWSAFEIHEVV